MGAKVGIFIIPLMVLLSLILAIYFKKSPFETFMAGVKDGYSLFKDLFPSLLAMLVAVNLLKASGFINDLGKVMNLLFLKGEFYAKMIPLMFFRPLSGSASLSVLNGICVNNADGLACKTASTIQASSDTTLYIIAMYFSAINVTKWRHTLKASLTAGVFGMIFAMILSLLFL